MSWRTVVLTNRAKVEYSMGYMVIREKEVHRVFMDEIGTILVATPGSRLYGRMGERMLETENQDYLLR